MISTLDTAPTIGERLREEMRRLGVKAPDLARAARVKTSFLYDVMSGKSTNPSTVKLAQVAAALGIGINQLVSPCPAQTIPTSHSPTDDYATIRRLSVEMVGGRLHVIAKDHESEPFQFRREWVETRLAARADDLCVLDVCGDGMAPTLCHHDVVLIDTRKTTPSPPGIFALFDGNGLMPKRLEYATGQKDGMLRIISDNPRYSSYECPPEAIWIIGRVVWFSREI